MKYIQLTILAAVSTLIISCSGMKEGNGQEANGPRQFTTVADAAAAAKQDMLDAFEKVNLGIDKEKLRASVPGNPVISGSMDWKALLNTDSATTPESIIGPENTIIVPLVNGNDVVTVVSLMSQNQQYSIAGLGDKQISSELDVVLRAVLNDPQTEVKIYEVPNLQATVYAVMKSGTAMYYTSYNNYSLRQPIDSKTLMAVLKSDALDFEKKFGPELKKGNLVR